MSETKTEMPISVTERKKAEELIKAKFRNLEQGLDNEVTSKRRELNRIWSHRIGLDKLKARHGALEKELAALDKQIDEMTSGYYDDDSDDHRVPKPIGKLGVAVDKLATAYEHAKAQLKEKQSEVLEHLWFGLLSSDALKLLAEIPTMSQLKSNGMSLLQMPAAKLLGPGK